MRFPGAAALNCWGGDVVKAASSGMADDRCATKVNQIYNGQMILLHGFIKKTQKTPKRDQDLARARKTEIEHHQKEIGP